MVHALGRLALRGDLAGLSKSDLGAAVVVEADFLAGLAGLAVLGEAVTLARGSFRGAWPMSSDHA